jgi:hypothetical protein
VAAQLVASRAVLSSTELVSCIVHHICRIHVKLSSIRNKYNTTDKSFLSGHATYFHSTWQRLTEGCHGNLNLTQLVNVCERIYDQRGMTYGIWEDRQSEPSYHGASVQSRRLYKMAEVLSLKGLIAWKKKRRAATLVTSNTVGEPSRLMLCTI